MRASTIIYPVPELLPDPRARFIQLINTCHALAVAGLKVKILAGFKNGHSRESIIGFYGLSDNTNLEIIKLPMLRMEGLFRFSWHGMFYCSLLLYLLGNISKQKQVIIFLRHLKLAAFILKLKKVLNVPMIFEVHEIFHLSTGSPDNQEKTKRLECLVYNNANVVISISGAILDYLYREGIFTGHAHVISDGVRKKWFSAGKELPGSYICYTGGLYLWKGVDILVKAMRYLPDERLVLVGGGSRLEELKGLALAEGVSDRVTFTGIVPHDSVPDYLSDAKVAVLPNIPDGPSEFSSPLKLFEYMACGVPVVASAIPAFSEIISHKKNALLFEPANARALAGCIRELLDNPEMAATLAEAAREEVKKYTYEKRAEKIAEVIETINAVGCGR